ncbi:hypothetical protein ACFQ4L_04070 [Lapidilactobacillus mulanensis]|uniref:GNAT family N-acetyltransferase n=1 Tax=Lapidilactobacillus mulanensis TaxID=2485999 RepID=A0ABW4DQA0_9LACO|nr:hypothetical protein [Lapidilactobacillus mulanensis]
MTSSRVSDNFGDHKATGYDAVAIKKFLQTHFSDEFVFVNVLLKRFSKPFYWQVTQASEGAVFYFQKGRHHYYLLDDIDATGMRKKGVATSFVQRLFSHERRHA